MALASIRAVAFFHPLGDNPFSSTPAWTSHNLNARIRLQKKIDKRVAQDKQKWVTHNFHADRGWGGWSGEGGGGFVRPINRVAHCRAFNDGVSGWKVWLVGGPQLKIRHNLTQFKYEARTRAGVRHLGFGREAESIRLVSGITTDPRGRVPW